MRTLADRFPELADLNRYRIEQDLSYRELGRLVGVPWRSLYTLLTNQNARPLDRTIYKIARFVQRHATSTERIA